jgi:hypothetical protein
VSLSLDKRADPPVDVNRDGLTDAGDTVDYTFTVTNTGALALSDIGVTDDKVGTVSCPASMLDPGASEICTAATYTITPADQTAGVAENTAVANGTPPGSTTPVDSQPSSTSTPVGTPAPAVSIDKTGSASGWDGNSLTAGETVDYSYLVTNIGNVDLTSVAVDDPTADPLVGPVTCPALPAPGLAPGDSMTCTAAPYTVLVNGATLVDTATATGSSVDGPAPRSDPSTVTLPSLPDPRVALEKTALVTPSADQGGYKLGDTVAYSYRVTNIGNVDLDSVAVDDPTHGAVSCPTPPPPGLAPGDSVMCTAEEPSVVGQFDIDTGQVTDTATAIGTATTGEDSPPSEPSTVTNPTLAIPLVSIEKAAMVSPFADQGGANSGDSIAYSYRVTNVGSVTLASVSVDDPTLGTVTCPALPSPGLGPQGTVTCTADATHTVTKADVDAGLVVDTATATGTTATQRTSPPSDPSTAVVPTVATPSVSLVKVATVSPSADQGGAKPGDTISYTYRVTNTGNVDLASVDVPDPSLGAVSCPSPASPGVAPGGTESCDAVSPHPVTIADAYAGRVVDTATATGVGVRGGQSPPSAPSTATVRTVAPDGLGSIDTDLARSPQWASPAHGTPSRLPWVLGALGLVVVSGVALSGLRRRGRRADPGSGPTGHGRGTRIALLSAAVLVVAATAVWLLPAGGPVDRSRPFPSVGAGPAGSATTAAPTGGSTHTRKTTATPAPASLVIPSVGVDAPLMPVGAAGAPATASLTVPEDVHDVGWWDGNVTDGHQRAQEEAPAPGQPGVAILAGHVDSAAGGPGALSRLGAVKPGATIEVVAADGSVTSWLVTAPPETVGKTTLPPALFATTGAARLAIVTCGGPFDTATGHYEDNVIVWGAPLSPPT